MLTIANKERDLPINDQIRCGSMLVIGPKGEQLGVKTKSDALTLADYAGFDLVLINDSANPPVCKLMDYGKYKFEQSKREKESKKKQKTVEVKEIRVTPNIEEHDFNFKTKNAKKCISKWRILYWKV